MGFLRFLYVITGVWAASRQTERASQAGSLAIAQIDDDNVEGLFAFYKNWIFTYVKIRRALPFVMYSRQSQSCFQTNPGTGLGLSINTLWPSPTLGQSALGDQCNQGNIGAHYDPTLSCGPFSDNHLCADLSIPASSADPTAQGFYACSPGNYTQNPYVCEAGDLSGKYGPLLFNLNVSLPALPTSTTTPPTPTTSASSSLSSSSTSSSTPTISSPTNMNFGSSSTDASLSELMRLIMSEGLTSSLFPSGQGLAIDQSFIKRTPDSFMRANRDRMSIPIDLLTGKSIALTCTDPSIVVACAQIDVHKGLLPEEAWEEVLTRRRLMQRGAVVERSLEGASNGYSFRGSLEKVPEAAFLPFDVLNPFGYAETLANQFVQTVQEFLNLSLVALTPKLDLFDGVFNRRFNFMSSLLNN